MRSHMKSYILSLFGIPSSCCHYINCSRWGSVTRARYFFSSSDISPIPPHSPSPFLSGWFPMLRLSSASPPAFVPIPLPPWLRPRGYTPKGAVVQTPLALPTTPLNMLSLSNTSLPPPSLQTILANARDAWHLPLYLSPYVPLLKSFPALTLFDNISSQVDPTALFTPFGSSFSPLLLSSSSLLEYSCSLFDSSQDSPMWCPHSVPRFTGDFPFLRHAQYWLYLHNKYQEAHELPPAPFILLTRFTPGTIPSSPSIC